MLDPWSVVTTRKSTENEEELRRLYGSEAVVSRVGEYNLIHLDAPTPDEVERRILEFDPEDLFDDDCPICRMIRGQGLDVIFLREWEKDVGEPQAAGGTEERRVLDGVGVGGSLQSR